MLFPRAPNPNAASGELAREIEVAKSTPSEFAQLEAEKELRHERLAKRHPRLAKVLRIRVEGFTDEAPAYDDSALQELARQEQAEFPHGNRT